MTSHGLYAKKSRNKFISSINKLALSHRMDVITAISEFMISLHTRTREEEQANVIDWCTALHTFFMPTVKAWTWIERNYFSTFFSKNISPTKNNRRGNVCMCVRERERATFPKVMRARGGLNISHQTSSRMTLRCTFFWMLALKDEIFSFVLSESRLSDLN